MWPGAGSFATEIAGGARLTLFARVWTRIGAAWPGSGSFATELASSTHSETAFPFANSYVSFAKIHFRSLNAFGNAFPNLFPSLFPYRRIPF